MYMYWMLLVFLVGYAYGDTRCLAKPGTCQSDDLNCPGGYESGLCTGAATRRCCLSSGGACLKVNMISRRKWQALAPRSSTKIKVPVSKVFIHHTAGSTCSSISSCSRVMRGIQRHHMNTNRWDDIGYSFLVGEDGNVYEGRGWANVGAHTKGHNSVSFAVSFMGNYMTAIPGANALKAAKDLIDCGIYLSKITSGYKLYGHRDAGTTSCPGDSLYAEIKTWPSYSSTPP